MVGYLAGTITISALQAGVPQSLLALIQAQLDPNSPGASQEVTIQTDGSGPVYVGMLSPVAGALSITNYGTQLEAGTAAGSPGASRTYGTSFRGALSPVASIQVLMTAAGTFHVELT